MWSEVLLAIVPVIMCITVLVLLWIGLGVLQSKYR